MALNWDKRGNFCCWLKRDPCALDTAYLLVSGFVRKVKGSAALSYCSSGPLWFCMPSATDCRAGKHVCCCSVPKSCLPSHGLQHTRLLCPLLSPGVCSDSCPLTQWCHPTISSSVVPSHSAFNLSEHKGLFQRVSSSHQLPKFQLQHQSFQWIFRTDFL